MNFDLQGGTERQRTWFTDAVAAITYPLDRITLEVPITWREDPSTDLQDEVASTSYTPISTAIQKDLDAGKDSVDGKVYEFYVETVAHEIGHVITSGLWSDDQKTRFCKLMRGKYPDDWAVGRWPQHLQETAAEVFKDFYLPKQRRVFSNRTDWKIPEDSRDALNRLYGEAMPMEMVLIINSRVSTIEGGGNGGDT